MPALNSNPPLAPARAGAGHNYFDQIRDSFAGLGEAIDADDLAGAQLAFAPLDWLTRIAPLGRQTQFADGLQAIGGALRRGDLAAAGAALDTLLQSRQPGFNARRRLSFAQI